MMTLAVPHPDINVKEMTEMRRIIFTITDYLARIFRDSYFGIGKPFV